MQLSPNDEALKYIPHDIYLGLRNDKQAGEAPNMLGNGGNAERFVNANLVVNALIQQARTEFSLPYPDNVNVTKGQPGQQEHFLVRARWDTAHGPPIVANCTLPGQLENIMAGWKPNYQGPLSEKPIIQILVKPEDWDNFTHDMVTGFNSGGMLKHELAELARLSSLPQTEVQKKLKIVSIHRGVAPHK